MLEYCVQSVTFGMCIALVAACSAPEIGSPRLKRSPRASEDASETTQAADDLDDEGDSPTPNPPTPSSTPDTTEPTPEVVPEGSFGAGTMILSIADVNIRSGEGTGFELLGTIPGGTRVKVESTSGASGWVKINYGGKVGYSIKSLLSLGKYSAARGKKMADRALALWNGKPSRDLCLAGVDDTAESAGAMPPGVSWLPRQPSAVAWQSYVLGKPEDLLARGYVRENLDVDHLPKGAIIGWRAGQCGYHSQYGHIEIVADDASSRACSDYCGAVKKNCGSPFVFIPIE